jgi:anaerobic selenocysteine-containing dehydrogenase
MSLEHEALSATLCVSYVSEDVTQIGSCAHVMLPAATSGESNLTSTNEERRLMRLSERCMGPPGSALPDSAKIAQAMERSWRAAGKNDVADKFKGYDRKTEDDGFMDCYHQQEGAALLSVLITAAQGCGDWAQDNMAAIDIARAAFDARASSADNRHLASR